MSIGQVETREVGFLKREIFAIQKFPSRFLKGEICRAEKKENQFQNIFKCEGPVMQFS